MGSEDVNRFLNTSATPALTIDTTPTAERANYFDAGIEQVPQFRPLILGIPLALRIAKRVNALLGARLFLVAPRSAKCRVESTRRKRVQQRFRLEQPAASLRAEDKRIRALLQCFAVLMHDQFGADFARVRIAKLDHFRKFVAGVDVQQRKRDFPRIKSFLRQA